MRQSKQYPHRISHGSRISVIIRVQYALYKEETLTQMS